MIAYILLGFYLISVVSCNICNVDNVDNYLTNIFDSKARLIKVSGILPTSLLTTLKLNDRLIIRDKSIQT